MKRRAATLPNEGTLAASFAQLAQTGEHTERAAAAVLQLVAAQDIRTLKAFDVAVAAAYQANGWHTKPGRPGAKSDRRAVPHTVRTYVWELRAAYRDGLDVWTFDTFYAMRLARKAKNVAAAAPAAAAPNGTAFAVIPADVAPNFEGVRVVSVDKPNGAIWHDLAVCFLHLKAEERSMFLRQLSRLLHKYQPQMQPTLQTA